MVVMSMTPVQSERYIGTEIPVIDLSCRREIVQEEIVNACEEYGFFKVINHAMPNDVVAKMEAVGLEFFSKPVKEKQQAGPANPLGYGSKTIGPNGDTGEVEYLLLHANQLPAKIICEEDQIEFSCVVMEYVGSVKELACEILELLAQGLGLEDTETFSRLIRDTESDSLLRLNHYPSYNCNKEDNNTVGRVGFGEHSDPQIITLLRSNGVAGLQILFPSTDAGAWVPVPPDPAAFFVNVGDALQAMANGRLVSVRHRAMVTSYDTRMSTVFFGAPPLHAWISPIPEMITNHRPRRYRSFTWSEFKKKMYSLRLGHNRLELFRFKAEEEA
ncbi:putative gibberellin 2-beta-dioxygenase [Dioscorea sansibarensis]